MLLDTVIKLLFVDLNGTFMDDWLAGEAGAASVFAAYGQTPPPLEDFIRHVAKKGSYPDFYKEHNVLDATVDDLHAHFLPGYKAALHRARIAPGAVTVVRSMRELGIWVHLLTMARHDLVDCIFEQFALDDHFDERHVHVVRKDEQMLQIMEEKGLKPRQCAHIGDMPKDAEYAHKAGVHNIILRNEHVPVDLFDGVPMDLYARHFFDLLTYIDEL